MSLIFAAIVPHPPLLIPGVGKERGLAELEKTKEALNRLEQALYTRRPQLIIVISPHEGLYEDTFVLNAHSTFSSSFEDFGDTATTQSWHGAPGFSSSISHLCRRHDIPVRQVSSEYISHGASVPLHYLTAHSPDVKILPIGFSNRSRQDHVAFGKILKEIIMSSRERVAVIASGDLSHCLGDKGHAPYSAKGAAFDPLFMDALRAHDVNALLTMDASVVEASGECGYRSALILYGIIQNIQTQLEVYSYEHPFGVGYMVGNFTL